jgi:hypothetical protein
MAEHLEMAAVKEGNHTNVADAIDWDVSLIAWHLQSQFVNHYTRMLNFHPDAVASGIGYPVQTYSQYSVEIPLSIFSVNKDGGNIL